MHVCAQQINCICWSLSGQWCAAFRAACLLLNVRVACLTHFPEQNAVSCKTLTAKQKELTFTFGCLEMVVLFKNEKNGASASESPKVKGRNAEKKVL